MALPILPLALGVAAIAALAFGAKKDAGGGAAPGTPQAPGAGPFPTPGTPGAPTFANPFDRGLTQQQVANIQTALSTETDPNKLDAFAKSLLPEFPIASAALTARAIVLRVAQAANIPAPPLPLPLPPPPAFIPPQAAPFGVPVVPPFVPASFPVPTPGAFPQSALVITNDTGPSGALLVRAIPDASGSSIGSNPHGSTVTVLGPAVNGFFPVAPLGFSSAQFLQLTGPAQLPTFGIPEVVIPGSPIFAPTAADLAVFPAIGSQAQVTTNDTGAAGRLNVRSSPPSGGVVGQVEHGSIVTITGPEQSGFLPISQGSINGWSSTQFLGPVALTFSAGRAGAGGARIEVTANLLGLRGSPDPRAPYIAQAPRGSQFTVVGPPRAGYLPVRDDAGRTAWASQLSVQHIGHGAQAAGNDVGTGPSTPFAELHATALALKTALATHGCRSYNEPLVKDFQRVAKRAGIYQGGIDGWYGTVTQAALSKIVGKPAPACFAEATGGPSNPNDYWSPIGV